MFIFVTLGSDDRFSVHRSLDSSDWPCRHTDWVRSHIEGRGQPTMTSSLVHENNGVQIFVAILLTTFSYPMSLNFESLCPLPLCYSSPWPFSCSWLLTLEFWKCASHLTIRTAACPLSLSANTDCWPSSPAATPIWIWVFIDQGQQARFSLCFFTSILHLLHCLSKE